GITYRDRIEGERRANLEAAIACYERALQVYTLAQYPEDYAMTQNNLGITYQNRIEGERRANLEAAIACYERALQVRTLAQYPTDHRDTQLNLAWLAMSDEAPMAQAQSDAESERVALDRAHAAFLAARQAQTELGWLAADAHGRRLLQGEHRLREQYARDAWCCFRLDDVQGAILALEAGRAQALIESQSLAGATLQDIRKDLAEQFQQARLALAEARVTGDNVPAARATLLAARSAIRESGHPEFLPGAPTWDEVAFAPATGQALVYLTATDFGGLALVVPSGGEPWGVELPDLTWQCVDDWLKRPDADGRIVGGYQYAVRHQSLGMLIQWLRYHANDAEQARRLALPLGSIPDAISSEFATVRTALAGVVAGWDAEARRIAGSQPTQAREMRTRLTTPLSEMLGSPLLARDLHWHFMGAELDTVLAALSVTLTRPLHAALAAHGLGGPDQPLALIPCGRLGALPIHAATARTDAHGDSISLIEACELTIQAAARTLGTARRALATMPQDGPVLAVGNPWPTWVPVEDADKQPRRLAVSELFWAAAEADGIDIVAANTKPRRQHTALLGSDATRKRILDALAQYAHDHAGAWVQIAAHGSADPADPTRSAMLLANGELLTLADLQRAALLTGVRLFNASGCVTALGDLDTAPDELGSFAAGLMQSGAVGAVATLWSVSDQATFALMLRFAQYFLGTPGTTPARALRQAVHWLRTVPRDELAELRRIARTRIKGIPLTATGRDRDADRGAELFEVTTRLSADHQAVEHALAELATINPEQPDDLPPCAHPYFWAAFIIYGA
ncbi:MAG: CHAT domain-containing protein, partial [Ktedonobacterales bacterium]|nr:CHAT domain-containing protein [Ktedonobacterales bacterium]